MSLSVDTLPLLTRTPPHWAAAVLSDPVSLLVDHAFLEKKAANNAMDMLTRWPGDWVTGWVETMTSVARDEAAHLNQVMRLILRRGGQMARVHKNPYANELRLLVRKGTAGETMDRLFVSALIEARSCERFSVLASQSADEELARFYHSLFTSELGHYKVFLRLAYRVSSVDEVDARWSEMLEFEARILSQQPVGPRIHSGVPGTDQLMDSAL